MKEEGERSIKETATKQTRKIKNKTKTKQREAERDRNREASTNAEINILKEKSN